jgi:WD40 repeat protein
LEIWNWRDGSRKIIQLSEGITDIRFSPDGQFIAVALGDPGVLICNARTGQCVNKLKGDHAMLSVAFMPNRKGLISGGWDKTLKCWDISFLEDGGMKATETGTVKEFLTLGEGEVRCFCVLRSYGNSHINFSSLTLSLCRPIVVRLSLAQEME